MSTCAFTTWYKGDSRTCGSSRRRGGLSSRACCAAAAAAAQGAKLMRSGKGVDTTPPFHATLPCRAAGCRSCHKCTCVWGSAPRAPCALPGATLGGLAQCCLEPCAAWSHGPDDGHTSIKCHPHPFGVWDPPQSWRTLPGPGQPLPAGPCPGACTRCAEGGGGEHWSAIGRAACTRP